MNEEWRAIEDFPSYEISNLGRLRRCVDKRHWKAGMILKTYTNNHGYVQAILSHNGFRKTVRIHRVVCTAFHGPPPKHNSEAAHNDGDRLNNIASNLRWTDAKGNSADRIKHGRQARGSQINMSKLTETKAAEIKRLSSNGVPQHSIAKQFGVTRQTIYRINRRITWTHV